MLVLEYFESSKRHQSCQRSVAFFEVNTDCGRSHAYPLLSLRIAKIEAGGARELQHHELLVAIAETVAKFVVDKTVQVAVQLVVEIKAEPKPKTLDERTLAAYESGGAPMKRVSSYGTP